MPCSIIRPASSFSNSSPNTIGGTTPAARNVILGGANPAIFDFTATGGGNTIQGNYIGVNAAGTAALGNTQISLSNANNLIGGTAVGAGNVISQIGRDAIFLNESGATGNTIQGNFIGVTADGTTNLGAGSAAISIQRANNNLIGGTDATDGATDGVVRARNIIVGSGGVSIVGASGLGENNIVQGNYIGTNAAGTARLPAGGSAGVGVDIGSPSGNTVGGTAAGAGNVVAGFNIGVRLNFSSNNIVQGNLIGTNAAGTAALPNSTGISLFGSVPASSNNTIGGTTAAARNIISGNGGNGVIINGGDSNILQGNFIGTQADGTTALGNGGNGIELDGGLNNSIGGTTAGAGNIIAFNGIDGVTLPISGPTGNAFLGNSIHSNGTTVNHLGIDLGTNGITPNDAGDPDTGPNNLQNFPVLASATAAGGNTTITGTFNSTPSTNNFRLEFFSNAACDASGNGEGRTFLGSTDRQHGRGRQRDHQHDALDGDRAGRVRHGDGDRRGEQHLGVLTVRRGRDGRADLHGDEYERQRRRLSASGCPRLERQRGRGHDCFRHDCLQRAAHHHAHVRQSGHHRQLRLGRYDHGAGREPAHRQREQQQQDFLDPRNAGRHNQRDDFDARQRRRRRSGQYLRRGDLQSRNADRQQFGHHRQLGGDGRRRHLRQHRRLADR